MQIYKLNWLLESIFLNSYQINYWMNTWINIPRSKVQGLYLVSTEEGVLLELITIIFPDERLMT